MKSIRSFFLLIITTVIISCTATAQWTKAYQDPEAAFRDAQDLFDKEKYEPAKVAFEKISEGIEDQHDLLKSEADYHAALCNIYLFHQNAAARMLSFIHDYPQSTRINEAYFYLAGYYYATKQYSEATKTYKEVEVKDLPNEIRPEFYFKKGYAAFSSKRYDDAKMAFYEIKDGDSKYAPLATYYYGYILYTEKKYETALRNFEKLQEDENFGSVVPFYIMQIFYKQEKYDQVIEKGPALKEKATPRRAVEIARLIGESYYYTNRYEEALPFLQTYYAQSAVVPTKEDLYILGYTYFQLKIYDTAVVYFQKVASYNQSDEVLQNTLYHLAYCYIQLDMPRFAQAAFQDASKMAYDARIQEDASYNYAKLAYELSFTPYHEAINSFQTFLQNYPKSKFAKEIYSYLVNMFLTTKNYKEAYVAIEKIPNRDAALQEAYQRISFNRGVELFNEGKYANAAEMFEKAMLTNFDEKIGALAIYWNAETDYRQGKYEASALGYEKLFITAVAKSMKEYNLAYYNAAYAYMQLKKYDKAISNFKEFVATAKQAEALTLKPDALQRLGDAYFMQKSFDNSVSYYDQALKADVAGKDYVLYQKALSLGALARFPEKVATLQNLLKDYPKSVYIPSAMNEIAATYLVLDDYARALDYYKKLAADYSNSPLGKNALLKQGLIYYNMDENDNALAMFESVVSKYPGSDEAKEALVSIRKIYVDMNKVDAFFDYAKKVKGTQVAPGEQDSLSFIAAENRYTANDCEQAKLGFTQYRDKFPKGYFILEATYYLADCQYRTNEHLAALQSYETVVAMPSNRFLPDAVQKAAALSYSTNNYQKAVHYYSLMKSMAENEAGIRTANIAIMRCWQYLEQPDSILLSANEVLQLQDITPEVAEEANYNILRAALKLGDTALVDQKYTELQHAKNQEIKAEAGFYQIEKLFRQGDFDAAEKQIFEFINDGSSNEYYLAKCYILWADIYRERGNNLQAKQTYQSIIDNYDGADLVQIATEKRDAIMAMEEEMKAKDAEIREQNAEEEEEIPLPEI